MSISAAEFLKWCEVFNVDFNGGTSGDVNSIIGTANQVIVSSPTGNVHLSLPQNIGTANTPTFAGLILGTTNLSLSGSFTAAFTMTGNTAVTFPTSGTLATTAGASGIVSSGTQNQLTWYAATGTTVSGLATAANGVLVTSAGSVPSISSTLPSTVQSNITQLGALIAFTYLATPGSGSANGFAFPGASAGAFGMQAGNGSAAAGGGLTMFGQNHPTKAGWVTAGLSSGVTAYFTVNDYGWLGTGTDVFTVSNTGQVVVGSPAAATAGKITINPVTASLGTLQITAVNSAGAFNGLLQNASLSAARTWTLPDATGTIALTSGTVTTATNLAGGTANDIPYQTAAGTTSFITETANGVLVYSAGGVPSSSTTLPSGLAATNMNLTTPTLGVASATSINFGGSSLANYVTAGTSTPTFTFSTPGDLSVSYAIRAGRYTRIGNVVTLALQLVCTPTFTTSAGTFSLTGIPIAASSTSDAIISMLPYGFAYPATATALYGYIAAGATTMQIYGGTPTGTNPQVGVTQFTSGVGIQINATFSYLV